MQITSWKRETTMQWRRKADWSGRGESVRCILGLILDMNSDAPVYYIYIYRINFNWLAFFDPRLNQKPDYHSKSQPVPNRMLVWNHLYHFGSNQVGRVDRLCAHPHLLSCISTLVNRFDIMRENFVICSSFSSDFCTYDTILERSFDLFRYLEIK